MKRTKLYSGIFLSLVMLVFCITSCKKNTEPVGGDGSPVPVQVKLSGIERMIVPSQIPTKNASNTTDRQHRATATQSEVVQTQVIPFNDKLSIIATLTLENEPQAAENTISTKASTNKTAERTNLADGIKYAVAVYNSDGSFKDHKIFTYGANSQQNDIFMLDGDKEYTFVAYSLNSATTLPSFNGQNIAYAQAKLTNIDGDLMYFEKKMTVTGNQTNYLDVVLRHQYCQVTTKLDASTANLGNITAVTAAFSPVLGTAGLQMMFKDSLLSATNTTASKALEFDAAALGAPIVTSKPALLISNNTESAKFDIASITIGGVTKTNLHLDAIRVVRGGRYNLNLTVARDPFNGQAIKILAFNPDKSGLSGSYNLATGMYASVAKMKLQNPANFGPTGTVVMPGFQYDVLDWTSLEANDPAYVKAKLAWADIIWIGASDYWMNSTGLSPNKPIELVMSALADKKKFAFFMNDYNALAIQFPASAFPAEGFSAQYISGLPSSTARQLTLMPGVGPNSGPFGNVTGTLTIYDKGGYINSPDIPGSGSNVAKIFMKNPAGFGIPNTVTNNAMVYDNIIVVGDQEWMLNAPPSIAVPNYGLYNGTSQAGESKESIIFCNMFSIAVEYLRTHK